MPARLIQTTREQHLVVNLRAKTRTLTTTSHVFFIDALGRLHHDCIQRRRTARLPATEKRLTVPTDAGATLDDKHDGEWLPDGKEAQGPEISSSCDLSQ